MKTILKRLLLALLFIPTVIFAQSKVTGMVTEQATALPIPAVNVIVKNTSRGASTDFDGKYSLAVNSGDVLVYSYVGYTTQEITYTGQSTINVVLIDDASLLDEIVVIGYGGVKKEDLTGSVDLVTEKDFNDGPIVSAQQLISGKIAGVNVSSGGGAPGEGQNITIRGVGSLSLNSSPLYVIDGFPIDNGGVGGTRNPLNLLNPSDIESITVLKDASATSIYGSRGANGVIIVTTKKGKNKDFEFNLSAKTTVYSPVDYVDVLSADEFRSVVPLDSNADATSIALLGNANTDWQDEIYQTAFGKDYGFSALGSAFGVPLRASLGYSDHDGVLLGDNFERLNASLSLSPTFLDESLKIQINAKGSYTENQFANRGAIGSATSFDPTQSPYDANSPYAGYFAWIDQSTGQQANLATTNPLALLNLVDDTAEVRRLLGNFKADYTLPFFKDITVTVNVGLDKSNSHGRNSTSQFIPTSDPTWNGSFSNYTQEATNKLFDAYVTYNKTFKENHNVTAVAGHSYQSFEYDNFSYNSEKEEDGLEYEFVDKSKNVLLSYFGRLNYNFDSRYLLTATLRADASSKLNPEDRWGYFPSLAAAWNISNENFMENSFFDDLKVRAGYGEVGNVNGLGDYLFLTRYTASTDSAGYQFGYNNGSPSFYQTYRPEAINTNLKWEIGRTLNLGLDFSILDRRITGLFNAYLRKTQDLIATSTVDPFTNFSNTIQANLGDMENKGIEIGLNVIPVQNDNFTWSFNYNVAFNENTVTSLPGDQPIGGISTGIGTNVQVHREGETPFSYLVYKQLYNTNGSPIEGAYADLNGDNVINDADKYLYKDALADVTMGFNTNLNYKNWDLAVISRASIGNYVYNDVASSKGALNNVVPTTNNYLSNLSSDYLNTGFLNTTETNALSDHYVEDGSFFKIDNITIGYNAKDILKDIDARFYGSLQNVATFTNYDGIDPEIGGGIDNNFYPRPRSLVLGVNIDF
ncbi:SusC/RagA family TonB-linked outer membrane protein [Olleya sp. Bg11-27]|uniref:SusC/RagA family TonB-linked outer membrane protein n=1 Tax=Olleya sp. Bg11-27 TaxID=2058135 RepID=UPI000C30F56F|nr:TonB-dependent receptor [Olleya sp. Bg11-27]AUC74331.1 SusC/RagA family TonB-linked outer membrane protein [Olleya sp. Bg11-27]